MYNFFELDPNKFYFSTKNNLKYEVEFSQIDFIFKEFYSIKYSAYEVTLAVNKVDFLKLPNEDFEIAETVSFIIHNFFSNNPNAFLIFHTDNSDGKAATRNRKFTQWFFHFNDISLEKFDKTLIRDDLTPHYICLLVKSKNPSKTIILDAFDEIMGDDYDSK